MYKAKRQMLIIICFLFIIVATLTTSLFAWLTDTQSTNLNGQTSELNIVYNIWFEQDGINGYSPTNDVDASQYYIGDNVNENNLRLILTSTGDTNALNYIGKLRVQVSIDTNASFYLRAKFSNEWYSARKSLSTGITRYKTINQTEETLMPFGLSSDWYYDQNTRYCYYQQVTSSLISNINIINSTSVSTYTDFSTATYETKYFAYVDIIFEYVQANRMYEIWNLYSIPTLE